MSSGRRENLIPVTERTKEEARELSRKGGINSGKARRAQKSLKEMANYILSCPLNEQGLDRLKKLGCEVDEKNPTMLTAMIMGQVQSAINGNTKSAEFITNLIDAKAEEHTNAQAFIDALNDCEVNETDVIEE